MDHSHSHSHSHDDSVQHYNELNKKAYGSERLPRFENPDFRAMSRLSVARSTSLNPAKGSRQVHEAKYTAETVSKAPAGEINTAIWKPGMRVLDFASGPGNISLDLIDQLGFSANELEIVGVDLSEPAIEWYKKRVPASYPTAYSVDILSDSPLDIGTFDVVICAMSYHHLPDMAAVTDKLVAKLNAGGWLIVTDMNGSMVTGGDKDTVVPKETKEDLGVAHTYLTDDDLRNVFAKAGLKSITSETGFQATCTEETSQLMGAAKGECKVIPLCVVAGQK